MKDNREIKTKIESLETELKQLMAEQAIRKEIIATAYRLIELNEQLAAITAGPHRVTDR